MVNDDLLSDNLPDRTAVLGFLEVVVEPPLLLAAHQTAVGIVADASDVVGVVVYVRDVAIVLTGVEHEDISELADLEFSPDAQRIGRVHLADGHPFKVGLDGVALALGEFDTVYSARFGVVRISASGIPSVVGDFVVVLKKMKMAAGSETGRSTSIFSPPS